MNMIIPEALYFSIVCCVNAYLSLFFRKIGYTATQIGMLFGYFNFSAIIVPFLLTPVISRKNKYSLWLIILGAVLLVSSVFLFSVKGFILIAVVMIVFGGVYQCIIPVSDSLITSTLQGRQEMYGMIRCAGTAGFIIMSLIMQKFIDMESISLLSMALWLIIPCFLFFSSMVIRDVAVSIADKKSDKNKALKDLNEENSEKESSTKTALKNFGAEYYLVLTVILLQFLGMIPPNMYVSLYAQEELKVDASGILWAVSAIGELPFMFLSVFFIKKFKAKPLIFVGTLAVIVRLYLYILIPNIYGAIAAQALNSLCYGLFFPSCVNYCTLKANNDKKALMISMTLLSGVYGLAKVIGSPIGGFMIDNFGYRALFTAFSIFPIIGLCLFIPIRKISLK